jgi:hypothetical protein
LTCSTLGARIERAIGRGVVRTAGTARDNLPPRASSELRAVVTKGSRTAEKALYSSRDLHETVL